MQPPSQRIGEHESFVLGRIADALMMDPTERAALFRLAVPELRSASMRFPELAAKRRGVHAAVELPDVSFTMADVRSQGGFVARLLAIHGADHELSDVDRAQLSTLADLTSFALSGRI
jgi:hypothetical protein